MKHIDEKYLDELVQKWEVLLSEEDDPKMRSKRLKRQTALMLENEEEYLMEQTPTYSYASGGPADSGDIAQFHKIAIPLARRVFPETIAHDLVGVQPLSGPVGLAFALRFRATASSGQYGAGSVGYTTDTEMGYNTVDPSYSGIYTAGRFEQNWYQTPLTTRTGRPRFDGLYNTYTNRGFDVAAGRDTGAGERLTSIPDVKLTIEKAHVEAATRKLRAEWSLEAAQDLKNMHGLDIESEMIDMMSYEITAEIDRELINIMRNVSPSTAWFATAADARWEMENYRVFYNYIIRLCNDIAVTTRRGAGNFIVASPHVCAVLETLNSFTPVPVPSDINTLVAGVAKVGAIDGRILLYRDTFGGPTIGANLYTSIAPNNHWTREYALVGYKGPSIYDAGVIYCPYVPLMISRAVVEDSFHPRVGIMSRYGIIDNLFGANLYYREILPDFGWQNA
jgi:hypothetical protein